MSTNTDKTTKKEIPDPVNIQLKKLAEAVENFSKLAETGEKVSKNVKLVNVKIRR